MADQKTLFSSLPPNKQSIASDPSNSSPDIKVHHNFHHSISASHAFIMVHKPVTASYPANGDSHRRQNGKAKNLHTTYENPPSPEESSRPTSNTNGVVEKNHCPTNGTAVHPALSFQSQQALSPAFSMMEGAHTILTPNYPLFNATQQPNSDTEPKEQRKRGRPSPARKRASRTPIESPATNATTFPATTLATTTVTNLPSMQLDHQTLASHFPPTPTPVVPTTLEPPRIDIKTDVETDISEDEDMRHTELSVEERLLSRKWEKTRCDIAWRWTWLQLQVHELEFQINKCDELFQKKRRNKQKVAPLFDPDDKQHSLRTSGLVKPKKNRKLFRVPSSSKSKSSGSLDRAAESHPLFAIRQGKEILLLLVIHPRPSPPPPLLCLPPLTLLPSLQSQRSLPNESEKLPQR